MARLYREVCAFWPRGEVSAAFRQMPPARVPVLLLSGGIDPATPPRHAERVAAALGAQARHEVVPQAGHGLLALPCVRDAVFRFVDAPSDADALRVDAGCARDIPRPPVFVPPGSEAAP
jgi:alpha-beta hydrolase superfamily lysophospholipase